jgi:hypothetical protein
VEVLANAPLQRGGFFVLVAWTLERRQIIQRLHTCVHTLLIQEVLQFDVG